MGLQDLFLPAHFSSFSFSLRVGRLSEQPVCEPCSWDLQHSLGRAEKCARAPAPCLTDKIRRYPLGAGPATDIQREAGLFPNLKVLLL